MTHTTRKGPVAYRLIVFVFSVLFAVLLFWLLGFVIDDIGTWPGPDHAELEKQLLDPQLVEAAASLSGQIEETNRKIRRNSKPTEITQGQH